MKIKFNISEFLEALDIVCIVNPGSMQNLPASYLFVARGEVCNLYSSNDELVAKASFPLLESSGDGEFVYPAEFLGALKHLRDEEVCTMEATEEDGKFKVQYSTGDKGASTERTTVDPNLLSASCEENLVSSATELEFNARVLREALTQGKPYLADLKDQKVGDNFKGLQIMDATRVDKEKGIDCSKGDGYLFVSDGVRTFFFQSDEFKGKSLEVFGSHLGVLQNFLGKCGDKVTIRKGGRYTFALNDTGGLIGWVRHNSLHDKFLYYALKGDQIVVQFVKSRCLTILRYLRCEMEKSSNKIKLQFSLEADGYTLGFSVEEGKSKTKSLPLPLMVKENTFERSNLELSVNIDHLIELVDMAKGNEIELRVRVFPPDANRKREVCFLRSIDEFHLDPSGKITPESEGNTKCRVTRYMASKD